MERTVVTGYSVGVQRNSDRENGGKLGENKEKKGGAMRRRFGFNKAVTVCDAREKEKQAGDSENRQTPDVASAQGN